MNRNEAFIHCLENAIKTHKAKGTWASYVSRFNKGELKEKTVITLLNEFGYVKTTEEEWEAVDEENKYYDICVFDLSNKTFALKTVQATSEAEAKQTAIDNMPGNNMVFESINVTGKPRKIISFVNSVLKKSYE